MPALASSRQANWRAACAGLPALRAAHGAVLEALAARVLPIAGQAALGVVCAPLPIPAVPPGVATGLGLQVSGDGLLRGSFHADAMALPLATRGVSLVEVVFALEAVEEPHALLSELARCLRAEGYLRVVGLSRASPMAWRYPRLWRCALGARRIANHLQDCGLTLLQAERIGAKLPAMAPAWMLLAQRRIPAGTRVSLDRRLWRAGIGVPVSRA